MRKLNLTKRAGDFLSTLPPKQFRQVHSKLNGLINNPRPHDSKKLKGYSDLYRTDIGEYRIVYSFNVNIIYIKVIGKRNDSKAYKQIS